ncbi:MAG: acyl-CoA hydrolase [Candidatus Magnetoglobus multicellularis str. Araruama]|uniref:Acyl-CoA hydrolase n=1 Tax=Candidatus Magnetoglobus multicellularis str. Araruama TaxID=890399 RepID=A0A1V1PHT2_9BACT|nr:MAG: acyl-CoA hydrolase [Candidatus Magnetoglobus multicellularis str. Araruama]
MKKKRISETSVTLTHIFMPHDANPSGNVHGGVLMKLIDNAAGVVAFRHARSNVVTASIDRFDFHHPGYIGDLLTVNASINHVGRTSMEIGARAETENLMTGERKHVVSAYLTFVALDENGNPKAVPELIIETPEEHRRYCNAIERRKSRMQLRNKTINCHMEPAA